MDREQIEKWAREADIYAYGECGTFSSGGAWKRTRDEHFARLVRDAALEEAKQAVLRVGPKYLNIGHEYICGSHDARYDCAAAIDALRSKP